MLEDLIRMTALDTGQVHLSPTPVDVVHVIEDAITSASVQFREKGLTVNFSLQDDLPPINADQDALTQIIGQLLTNAYLVSPPDSELFIRAYARRMTLNDQMVDCAYVAVEDRGGGIPPEDVARVFARKYKAENPLIEGLGDTGVGLSIARALVEAHGGQLWLETKMGVGSTFSFALPIQPMVER
jgi:signal transduction histidine kinase